ncbi:MAG: hypothetical protein DMF59_12535, partial [Acidobacteria bacterium]
AAMAGVNVMQFLRPIVFLYFPIFFLLAYFTFVCIYAIGGAVCNSEKEAQQLIAPISMIMMLPWFLMFVIITNPDAKMSVAFSLSPVFGPITMFVRTLVSEPPVWHILLSIAISIATILAFFWVTAKIFRVRWPDTIRPQPRRCRWRSELSTISTPSRARSIARRR